MYSQMLPIARGRPQNLAKHVTPGPPVKFTKQLQYKYGRDFYTTERGAPFLT